MLCRTREEVMRVPVSYTAMIWMKMPVILEYYPSHEEKVQ